MLSLACTARPKTLLTGDDDCSVDVVYLGTGFIIRYEYLERGGILQRRPGESLPEPENEKWPGIISTDLYSKLPH